MSRQLSRKEGSGMLHTCLWTPSTSPSLYLGPRRSSQSEVGCWDPSPSPLFPPPPTRGDPLASAAPAWCIQLGHEIQLWPSPALKGQGQGRKESPGAVPVAGIGFGVGLRKGGGGTFTCVTEFSWTLLCQALWWLAS